MKKIVVLSGAGISAESGLKTFRGDGGLWNGYRVQEVATPEAWQKDPQMVLDFYNMRRREVANAEPNKGHLAVKEMEEFADVTVITQNVDNLHERAGSSRILHLHGLITRARSSVNPDLVQDIGYNDLEMGMKAEDGTQLRPDIVWFGEPVPFIPEAARIISRCDALVITGTSLQVYPAAGLIDYLPSNAPCYVVDIDIPYVPSLIHLITIEKPGSIGLPEVVKQLRKSFS